MATNRKVIQPTSLPTPSAPYSLAIRTGDLIVTAGIVSTDKEGRPPAPISARSPGTSSKRLRRSSYPKAQVLQM